MANYFRITGYYPPENLSMIVDSYGMFEKKWQFSSFLVKKGIKIIAISDDTQFLEGNIEKVTEPCNDQLIVRACQKGQPIKKEVTLDNEKYMAIEVEEKYYIPLN